MRVGVFIYKTLWLVMVKGLSDCFCKKVIWIWVRKKGGGCVIKLSGLDIKNFKSLWKFLSTEAKICQIWGKFQKKLKKVFYKFC